MNGQEDHYEKCGDNLDPEIRKVDFSTFVLSLGTSVLVQLGQMGHDDGPKPMVSLPMARQIIDIITMLQDKTRGNLTEDEGKLIETLLFDLRLKFVDACKAASSANTTQD
jgi:hypothetical protein